MPSTMQFSLLALASTAAAIPHYSHSKFHKPSGYTPSGTGAPFPYGGNNETAAGPTGTGTGAYGDSKTTTVLATDYSTATIVSTIYAQKPSGGQGAAPSSVGAAGASQSAGAAGGCGPETVYVTATDKVTVTVGAGGAPSSAAKAESSGPVYSAPASSAPAASVPGGGYGASSVVFQLPSSVGEARVSHKASSAAVSVAISSVVPVMSSAPAVTPTPSATPVQVAPSSAAAVSSAAASSSSTPSGPTYSGGKRGLSYKKVDVGMCSGFKASWAYNWESIPTQDKNGLPSGVTFYPTMHSPNFITVDQWKSDAANAIQAGADVVFGFNEPDKTGVSVTDACTAWSNYMKPIKDSHPAVTVVGPSVSNSNLAGEGLQWLQSFQKDCPSAQWDAANVHFYWSWEEGLAKRLQTLVEAVHAQTGKKVWVTEYGLNDFVASQEQAAQMIKECSDYLEGAPEVAGYSYFKVGSEAYNLNSGASALSSAYGM